jgi:hypothetical protein
MNSFEFINGITYKQWVMTDPSTLMPAIPWEELIDDLTYEVWTYFHPQFCSSILGSNLTQCKESSLEHDSVVTADSADVALS